jgi:putative flippase GtrA
MKESERFVAFVAVGGFASVVNLVARLIFDTVTSYEAAILLAFPVALTTAFLLNRAFVFRSGDGGWERQYWRFLLVNLATLVQIFLVSVALARFIFPASGFTWHADTVAHAIGLVVPIFTSYWMHKRFSFAPAGPSGRRVP